MASAPGVVLTRHPFQVDVTLTRVNILVISLSLRHNQRCAAMPRICTICAHPKRSEIDRRLLAGEPVRAIVRAIAGHVPISKTSLQRHQQHVSEAISKSRDAVELVRGDDLVSELQRLASEARRLQAKAEADGDTRTAIAALRELTRLIELRARVLGELRDRQVNVLNVNLDETTATRIAEVYLSRRKAPDALVP